VTLQFAGGSPANARSMISSSLFGDRTVLEEQLGITDD
jgi:hypothetical protein